MQTSEHSSLSTALVMNLWMRRQPYGPYIAKGSDWLTHLSHTDVQNQRDILTDNSSRQVNLHETVASIKSIDVVNDAVCYPLITTRGLCRRQLFTLTKPSSTLFFSRNS